MRSLSFGSSNAFANKNRLKHIQAVLFVALFAILGSIAIVIFAAPAASCSVVCVSSPVAGSTQSANFAIKTTALPPSSAPSYSEVVTLDANTENEQVVDTHVQPKATTGTQTFNFAGGPAATPSLFDYRLLSPGKHTITAELFAGTSPTYGNLLGSTTNSFTVSSVSNLATNDGPTPTLMAAKLPYSGSTAPRSVASAKLSAPANRHVGFFSKAISQLVPRANANWPGAKSDVLIRTFVDNPSGGDVVASKGMPHQSFDLMNNQLTYYGDNPTAADTLGYACTSGGQPITYSVGYGGNPGGTPQPGDTYGYSYNLNFYAYTATNGEVLFKDCALNNLLSELQHNGGTSTYMITAGTALGYTFKGMVQESTGSTSNNFLQPYNGPNPQIYTYTYSQVDTDGDGVPDNSDKCPSAAGPSGSDGCPSSAFDPINGPSIGLTQVTADHAVVDLFAAGLNDAGAPKGLLKNVTATVDGKVTDNRDITASPNPITYTDYSLALGNISNTKPHSVVISAYNNNGETISRLRFHIDPATTPPPVDTHTYTSSFPDTHLVAEYGAYSATYHAGNSRSIVFSTKENPDESKNYIGQTLTALGRVNVSATNVNATMQCSNGTTGTTASKTGSYTFTACPVNPHHPPYYPKKYKLTATIPVGYHVDRNYVRKYGVHYEINPAGIKVATRNFTLKKYGTSPAQVSFIYAKDTAAFPAPSTATSPGPIAIPDSTPSGTFKTDTNASVLAYINAARASAGVPPLKASPNADVENRIQTAARSHILEMIMTNTFSHFDISESGDPNSCINFNDRVTHFGIYESAQNVNPSGSILLGENLGFSDAQAPGDPYASIEDAWLKSPGHYANIIDPDFKYVSTATIQGVNGYAARLFTKNSDGHEVCGTYAQPEAPTAANNATIMATIFSGGY
ncbi:MAG: CAP domain-containing protein [Patescibacteria group bacterium]|nr:CAP domain-containing protein [Patescibacteria group bacterium]